MTDNGRGAMFMTISMAGFSLNDALIKLLLTNMNMALFQAIFLRGLFSIALMGSIVWLSKAPLPSISMGDARTLGLRLIGEIGGTICFLSALSHMPLASATAVLQAMPLAVTLAAALFLGERVGWRRYLAISVGFAGMLLIVRPGAEQFNVYVLYAVGAVVFFVLRDLATRRIAAHIHSAVISLMTSIAITITGAVLCLFSPWTALSPGNLFPLAIAAVCVVTGYFFGVRAMRVGEVAAVSPFRYSILIWAILLGIVLFGDWPDTLMLAGTALLVASGLYTLHREQVLRRTSR